MTVGGLSSQLEVREVSIGDRFSFSIILLLLIFGLAGLLTELSTLSCGWVSYRWYAFLIYSTCNLQLTNTPFFSLSALPCLVLSDLVHLNHSNGSQKKP